MNRRAMIALAGGAIGLVSAAQADVVFTVERNLGPGNNGNIPEQSVQYLARFNNSTTTKVTREQVSASIQAQNPGLGFQDSYVRLADVAVGANDNEFILTQGTFNDNEYVLARVGGQAALGAVLRINGITNVAPGVQTLTSSGFVSNAIGTVYHAPTNSTLNVLNPGGLMSPSMRTDGIVGVNYTTGAQTVMFNESPPDPMPRYQAGAYITKDGRANAGANEHLVTSIQGGINGNGQVGNNAGGAQLYRFNFANDLTGGTMTRVVDFTNTAETGQASNFLIGNTRDMFNNGGVRGVVSVPGTNEVYVAFRFFGIWQVLLNNDGSYNSMSQISNMDLLDAIAYDPFEDKIVFGSNQFNATGLWEINRDGTGLNQLVADVLVRGIDVRQNIVPAPAGIALMGLAGLLAARRRR